jgi:intracellular multiplication protein IcmG
MEPTESGAHGTTMSSPASTSNKNIKRNALIAIVVIIFLMIMYKLLGYLFFSKDTEVAQNSNDVAAVTSMPTVQNTIQPQQPIVVAPVIPQPVQPVVSDNNYSNLTQKVAAIEVSQQNVRSEVSNVSQQVGSVNNNISNLNNEIANLNVVIKGLSTQLAKQTEEINILMARTQPKPVLKQIIKTTTPPLIYYIQAVIPGRAWLIGTNGSTLTVREGTRVAGYGVVKLIDPLQGRVVTSSGQVIRFSQEDS